MITALKLYSNVDVVVKTEGWVACSKCFVNGETIILVRINCQFINPTGFLPAARAQEKKPYYNRRQLLFFRQHYQPTGTYVVRAVLTDRVTTRKIMKF